MLRWTENALHLRRDLSHAGDHLKLREIEASIEGPWVDRIRELNSRKIQHRQNVHEGDAKKRREEPAKLADLKDRFGIK